MTQSTDFLRTILGMGLLGALLATGAFAQDYAMGTKVTGGAGTTCQYPAPPTTCTTAELHEITLDCAPDCPTRCVFCTGLSGVNVQPNAQAWDDANGRFFYAEVQTGEFYVWLRSTGESYSLGNLKTTAGAGFPSLCCQDPTSCDPGDAGDCSGDQAGRACGLASAAYWGDDGAYYFIPDWTDDLWKATFTPTGAAPFIALDAVTKVADLTDNGRCWEFGDVAIDFTDDTLYGSGNVTSIAPIAGIAAVGDVEFFSYGLTGGTFSAIRSAPADMDYFLAQLTFNQPFDTLYGFRSADGDVYTIDITNGLYTFEGNSSPVVRYRDVGGASSVPIPVTLMDFTVSDQ